MSSEPVAEDRLAALRSVSVFSGLSADLLARLAGKAVAHRALAGDWLFRQGDEADRLFVVVSGRLDIELEVPEPGRHIGTLAAGASVGELGVLTRSPRTASVRAVRDSELLGVDRHAIEALIGEEPSFAAAMVGALASHLQANVAPVVGRPPIAVLTVLTPPEARWTDRVTDALLDALRSTGKVAAVSAPAGGDPSAYGRLLDQRERQHDLVVLAATVADPADDWTRFCLRQADRVLVIADRATPRPLLDANIDLHVAGCGPGRRPAAEVARWLDQAPVATHHHVDLGPSFTGDVARLARRLVGRSLGVVLSGGGARGFAHIGVLDVLVGAGFEIDRLGGCSMGSLMAALFAAGVPPVEMVERCRRELVERNPFNDYTVPRASLLRAQRAQRMLERILGPVHLEEMPRSCFTVSCDLVDAECVVHRRGPAWEAAGISMCIPGLVPPVVRGNRILVDGGLLDNMPVDVMAAEAGPIVAVDVVAGGWRPRTTGRFFPRRAGRAPAGVPLLWETLARTSVVGSRRMNQENRLRADLVISPEVGDVGLLAFDQLDDVVEAGRVAAREAIGALGQVLGRPPA
ncbi:MAG: hypothetical protein QOG43_2845 [Actinomycetota bacterium]|jgi:predicted acylesterase/phospholipase RssA/CRP-like cAMP-binding protein|nr:hypothetical protein [Actinomycetota bacterium]